MPAVDVKTNRPEKLVHSVEHWLVLDLITAYTVSQPARRQLWEKMFSFSNLSIRTHTGNGKKCCTLRVIQNTSHGFASRPITCSLASKTSDVWINARQQDTRGAPPFWKWRYKSMLRAAKTDNFLFVPPSVTFLGTMVRTVASDVGNSIFTEVLEPNCVEPPRLQN